MAEIAGPLSEPARKQIAQSRSKIEAAGLKIEIVDVTCWRVIAPDGPELFYFPVEDRWRHDKQWGRGTVTLISALKP